MKITTTICILIGLLAISACDEAPKPKIANPLAGQAEALQKAKEAERQLLDAAEKQRKTIDDLTN